MHRRFPSALVSASLPSDHVLPALSCFSFCLRAATSVLRAWQRANQDRPASRRGAQNASKPWASGNADRRVDDRLSYARPGDDRHPAWEDACRFRALCPVASRRAHSCRVSRAHGARQQALVPAQACWDREPRAGGPALRRPYCHPLSCCLSCCLPCRQSCCLSCRPCRVFVGSGAAPRCARSAMAARPRSERARQAPALSPAQRFQAPLPRLHGVPQRLQPVRAPEPSRCSALRRPQHLSLRFGGWRRPR